jgi:hypothetical protein
MPWVDQQYHCHSVCGSVPGGGEYMENTPDASAKKGEHAKTHNLISQKHEVLDPLAHLLLPMASLRLLLGWDTSAGNPVKIAHFEKTCTWEELCEQELKNRGSRIIELLHWD